MTPAQTIGILGGTFNPVHIGHLRLATAVAEALRLKHVDLMPCAVPPHKADSGLLSFEMRVSLLQGALETPPNAAPSDARLQVSTLEGELPHPSYTWNLITEWRKRHTSPCSSSGVRISCTWTHGTGVWSFPTSPTLS